MTSESGAGHGSVPGTGTGMTTVVIEKPVKQVRFACKADWIQVQDRGYDHYTFDNIDDNGNPKVRQEAKQREGPPPRKKSSTAEAILAHKRAADWVLGANPGW